jgi:hypothetical protein
MMAGRESTYEGARWSMVCPKCGHVFSVNIIKSLSDVKMAVYIRGKKIKDLSSCLGLSYSVVSGVINGYQKIPMDFYSNVENVITKWDKE